MNTILNRVKNDITKHTKDIQDKLHDIVKQIIMQQMSNWEAKPPIPSKSFQTICKYEIGVLIINWIILFLFILFLKAYM